MQYRGFKNTISAIPHTNIGCGYISSREQVIMALLWNSLAQLEIEIAPANIVN